VSGDLPCPHLDLMPLSGPVANGASARGPTGCYCSLAYSALACFRMGMLGSASFQSVRKSLYEVSALTRAASASAPCEVQCQL
jgi:hypothetical protein